MKRPVMPPSYGAIYPKPYQRLVDEETFNSLQDDLYEKRLLAIEWMQRKGLEILGREHEHDR